MPTSVKQRESTPFSRLKMKLQNLGIRLYLSRNASRRSPFLAKTIYFMQSSGVFLAKIQGHGDLCRIADGAEWLLLEVISQETTCRMSGIIETCSLSRPVTGGHTNYRPPPSFLAALSLPCIPSPSSQTKI